MSEATTGAAGLSLQPAGPIVLDFTQKSATRPAEPGAALPYRHEIRFTGSGSEYFRIWIVNLLLTLVTLTLYYPWAKVRKLRYFHTNTHVAGHALDFHGEPRRMLRGHLLVLGLAGAYALAGAVSEIAQGVALLILAALWPALWRASMQFRLGNTSWRGLRFRFAGSVGGAYGVVLAPLGVLVLLGVIGGLLSAAAPSKQGWVLLPSLLMLAAYGLVPWLWLRLKRYQHDHYGLGRVQTRLDVSTPAVYGVFLRTLGIGLLAGAAVAAAMGMVAAFFFGGLRAGGSAFVYFAPVLGFAFLILQALPRAYATSRLQNLVWSGTGVRSLRFDSALRFTPLAALMLKNWLLVIVTLGLYWPWAATALARMRLEAVELRSRAPLDELSAGAAASRGDAAADAAGDAFGIDFGL